TLWGWWALWAVIGVAQAGSFYETCFAFLTRRLGPGARAAITHVTLVAGFAGTLAFPLGAFLGGQFGGQGALVALAAIVALVAVPVNLGGVVLLRRQERAAGIAAPPGLLGHHRRFRRDQPQSRHPADLCAGPVPRSRRRAGHGGGRRRLSRPGTGGRGDRAAFYRGA
ncbi:MAG: hypothetical protein ACK4TH_12820, partial [Tepidimonas sp.]